MRGEGSSALRVAAMAACIVMMQGCRDRGEAIYERAVSTGEVDLAAVVPGSWEKVCVLGPYSQSRDTERILGFHVFLDAISSIGHDDGINLLIFVRQGKLHDRREHERRFGDFAPLAGHCFGRDHARFTLADRGDGGKVFVPTRD